MKVLVVTHYYASHGGGIEIIAENLIRELCHLGIAVMWAASDVDEPPAETISLRTLPMSASNFAERRLGFPYPLWSPASLFRLVRAIDEADVVHLHDSLYFGNVWAFALAILKRKPVLVTQHIGDVPYHSRIRRALMKAANASVGRILLSRADLVVFYADQVRRFYEARLRFRATPLFVENGVDTAIFASESGVGERMHLRDTLRLDPERPIFLFVGRFVEKKGLVLLQSLARALPQVQWLFAGWGPLDPATWDLPQVRVFYRCTPVMLRKLYVAADLLVLPSVGEGFPLVVQESMACGTPAIVARETAAACPAAGSLILHERVDGSSAQSSWRRRLELLASTLPALDALRPQVAALARDRWSWVRTAAAYEQCYDRLVTAPRAGRRPTPSR